MERMGPASQPHCFPSSVNNAGPVLKEQSAATHVITQGRGVAAANQSMNAVEVAMPKCRQEKSVDLKEVLLQIRSLVSQVERAAEQIGSLVKIDLSSIQTLAVECPFDRAHKIVPEGLFQHYLRCPSGPKPPLNAQPLLDSLTYRGRVDQGHRSSDISSAEQDSRRRATTDLTSGSGSSSRNKFDIWGGHFFYDGASAVVQAPLCTLYPPSRNIPLSQVEVPGRLCPKSGLTDAIEPDSTRETPVSGNALLLLPSRYFFLSREIQAWEGLPSRSSSLVLEAAIALQRVGKPTVVSWLLVNSPAHGIVIDSILACHIYSLIKLCLQEVYNEAYAVIERADYKPVAVGPAYGLNDERTADVQTVKSKTSDSVAAKYLYPQVQFVDCVRVFRSVDWLSAQLCPLYGSAQSKTFCLNLLKHLMASSGRLLCSPFTDAFGCSEWVTRGSKVENESRDSKGALQNENGIERADSRAFEPLMVSDDLRSTEMVAVGNSSTMVQELEAAVAAVNERAVLERYLRTPLHANRLPKFQTIQEYDAAVKLAAEERLKRPNYRAVLEFDGLIWHRSQLEEKNKNKSREEILAEERDYKRRRMSYRGKRLKRTPTQVVHDIIESHMDEIVSAGGIGCFIKQSVQVLPSALQHNCKDEASLASSGSSFAEAAKQQRPL